MITGGCLCGAVRWELEVPPTTFTYCHCTRCQRRTGGSYSAQARVDDPAALRFVSGEELVTGWDPCDGGWVKCFCSTCGSQLFSKKPDGSVWSIRMGSFDEPPPGIAPKHRQFVADAATWEPIPDDGLPRYEDGGT